MNFSSLSRPWPVFRANMRSSRNLMFVSKRRRETLKFRQGSIFGTRMSMIWALPQRRNRPDVFSHGLPTRAVTNPSLEKYFYWDDILEFWALNQHFGERMDHGSRTISSYDQLLRGRQGRPGPRGPHSSISRISALNVTRSALVTENINWINVMLRETWLFHFADIITSQWLNRIVLW